MGNSGYSMGRRAAAVLVPVVAAVVVLAVAGACGPRVHLRTNADFAAGQKASPQHGTVVLSIQQKSNWGVVYFRYRTVGATFGRVFHVGRRNEWDWQDPAGRLIIQELPPGQYELFRYESRNGTLYSDGFSYRFHVSPGVVTYIGGILLVSTSLMNNQFALVDASERDLALLKQKAPALANVNVKIGLMR